MSLSLTSQYHYIHIQHSVFWHGHTTIRHVSTVTTCHCGLKLCSYSSCYMNIMHTILIHNISRDLGHKPLYLQAWVSKSFDRLISVEHSNWHTRSLEVINLYPLRGTTLGCEHQLHLQTFSSHCHKCLQILAQDCNMSLTRELPFYVGINSVF